MTAEKAKDDLEQFFRSALFEETGDKRRGEHAALVLMEMRPDISREIRNTERDPMFLDARMPSFLAAVARLWRR